MSDQDSRLVYSSDQPSSKKDRTKKKKSGYQQSAGPCKVRLEKKGRGGKQVSVIYDLPYSQSSAKQIMKKLQDMFACGATLKDSTIILSGDFCEQIRDLIKKKEI